LDSGKMLAFCCFLAALIYQSSMSAEGIEWSSLACDLQFTKFKVLRKVWRTVLCGTCAMHSFRVCQLPTHQKSSNAVLYL